MASFIQPSSTTSYRAKESLYCLSLIAGKPSGPAAELDKKNQWPQLSLLLYDQYQTVLLGYCIYT